MIPFIRSIKELMIMSNSREDLVQRKYDLNVNEESEKGKRYLHSIRANQLELPNIPKKTNLNWLKSKKAIKKFFDDLDYNNQNISSYDLTLMKKQEQKDYHEAA